MSIRNTIWRAVIVAGLIIFFLYSNLLMAEFKRTGTGHARSFASALGDMFTASNFLIAVIAAFVGCMLVEFLRNRS